MRGALICAALAALALSSSASGAPALPTPPPQAAVPSPPTSATEARKQATGCKVLYTRRQHRRYVTRVYRSSRPMTKHKHQGSYIRTRCQHTVRSERISRRKWHRERRRRARILARGNAGLGYLMFMERGGTEAQFRCLDILWGDRESGWRTGEYGGIPQARPASRLAEAGRDWQTSARTQIRWGLNYIRGRYRTACAALAHSYLTNWY